MNGDHGKIRLFKKGDRVEVESRDGWLSGTITDFHHSYTGVLVFVKLDDGRDSICGSEKCIRLLKDEPK